jgi:uncharacterized membrane protein YhaH (DUF805 family)
MPLHAGAFVAGKSGRSTRVGLMRGDVLHYDEEQGIGFIAGAGGKRYSFERGDLRRMVPIGKGTPVEFQPSGDFAREIFVVRPERHATNPAPSQFGRLAAPGGAENTGLWSYFWRSVTSNYWNFGGRARRKEIWGFYLFYVVVLTVLICAGLAIDAALGNLDQNGPIGTVVLLVPFTLVTFVPYVALVVRRLHDIGLSGWFFLLIFLPYIGSLVILVFAFIPSQKHENKWGPVPAGIRPNQPLAAPAA